MINWNPDNFPVLYFHFVGRCGEDTYIRVDTVNQKVYKVTLNQGAKRGRPYTRGFSEIKWMTFISNYLHFIPNKKLIARFGKPYRELKYTTLTQYLKALDKIYNEFKGQLK